VPVVDRADTPDELEVLGGIVEVRVQQQRPFAPLLPDP
jgi:hypothetical protein